MLFANVLVQRRVLAVSVNATTRRTLCADDVVSLTLSLCDLDWRLWEFAWPEIGGGPEEEGLFEAGGPIC
jgi:hypothetical protein